ncbi:MAG: lipopolysaccharide biosynthesis protein [Gammaproteobacteria bacterium]|nr:lipopolysaccharide biosynthesis protein [Gammaproteobacteria bacterium]
MFDVLLPVFARWRFVLACTVLAALAGFGITFVLTPIYSARVSFLPPQQASNANNAVLGQLGTLAAALGGTSLKTPTDLFMGLAQSVTVADLLIKKFDLLKRYDEKYVAEARKELAKRMRVAVGKRDGFIMIEIDDESPQRAADMANQVVEELKLFANRLAITEAQQRRVFFEHHLEETRARLKLAQQALATSGFTGDALKAEPRGAAEHYAKLRAEVTVAEVRLQALQRSFAADAAEVQRAQATLVALRGQLTRVEDSEPHTSSAEYISKYRDFKFEEALFELFAKQYELARVDESRDAGLVQVIDPALAPERRSWPRRSVFTPVAAVAGLLFACIWVLALDFLRQPGEGGQRRSERLRDALATRR